MKERPIIFSGPMVRAILDGRKTQTRRVIKRPPMGYPLFDASIKQWRYSTAKFKCPYGVIGDRLWIRETWQTYKEFDGVRPSEMSNQSEIQYPASYDGWDSRKRPSIHMPRWASRITLKIIDVRVERLMAISNDDARAEGIPIDSKAVVWSYRQIWEAINGPDSWEQNPWVWVIEFERVTP